MGKLRSMTDFVLEQFNKWKECNNPDCQSSGRYILGTSNYANFLKQILELWMFVPVSTRGNILTEPVNYSAYEVGMSGKDFHFNFVDCQEYQEAKDRVLFENIEYVESKKEDDYSFFRIAELSQINYPKFWKNYTIEDLVKYNLVLTPTALKQIGYE